MSIACGPMTLAELRAASPHLFYAQTWFSGEAFLRTLPSDPLPAAPTRLVRLGEIPSSRQGLPSAVDLAHQYVQSPDAPIWRKYLWCAETDRDGQRIYVGGVTATTGFQIHRHLAITMKWGVPTR